MARALIAYTVCFVLALLGVSGAHVHAHGIGHHDHEASHTADRHAAHETIHGTDRDFADEAVYDS